MKKSAVLSWLCLSLIVAQAMPAHHAQQRSATPQISEFPDWKTNTEKRSIDLDDLISPGMPKDGIPSIDHPKFVTVEAARSWISPTEPVIALNVNRIARAYPLQILIWHEVCNDQIGPTPVVITFCSICNSAIVFKRSISRRVLSFGISGFVHGANMVLYDRETESWWQQFTGKAIVGDLTGSKLIRLNAQMISFSQFSSAFPAGQVLSRQTGFVRDYGRNPHLRYDNPRGTPNHFRGKPDKRLTPMERVIGVEIGEQARAYPYSITAARRVTYDTIGSQELVIFHAEGATSALDADELKKSREVGSTGVFDPRVDGRRLDFAYSNGEFVDAQTGSHWNIVGKAVEGPLKGKMLNPLAHGDYFAFAWLAFKPSTDIFHN